MTPLNTIIEEEVDNLFDTEYITGKQPNLTKENVTTAMQRAYEAGQSEERAKIREEVEGLLKTEYNIDFRTIEKVLAKLTESDKTT